MICGVASQKNDPGDHFSEATRVRPDRVGALGYLDTIKAEFVTKFLHLAFQLFHSQIPKFYIRQPTPLQFRQPNLL